MTGFAKSRNWKVDAGNREGVVAIGLIMLAMLAFALQDMVIKIVAEQASLWQLQAIRSAASLILIAAIATYLGRLKTLHTDCFRWPLLRALLTASAYFLFYASLPMLTLTQAAAAFYIGPLFIALLAALLLREPIGWRRIVAVFLGFAGVLFILRPWDEAWRPWVLMPIAAAFCYALGVVVTRRYRRTHSPLQLGWVQNVLYTVIGLAGIMLVPNLPVHASRDAVPFLLSGWNPIGALAIALILSTAISHLVGMLCSIRAYQSEEVSRLAPFEYSYLAIIPFFDFLGWAVLPDPLTLLGIALIASGGIFVAMRGNKGRA